MGFTANDSLIGSTASDRGIPRAAYLHIPFCRRRCYYCDFPITVVGDHLKGNQSGTIEQYVEVLCREISLAPIFNTSLRTVFFGGGTPSLLSVGQLQRILEALDRHLGIATNAEISMEMDPGTFDLAQVQGYRQLGINRISLGVQAFQPELLAVCGRSHTVADIEAAVDLLHQVGVPSWSLDLISGLPHQTLEQWQASLDAAIALSPNHLSTYDLTIESGTVFGRRYQPGDQPLPSDSTTAQMYRLAQQALTGAGYEHYEISNYAQPGHQCRHNRVYWENRPYYGFGMGATSYVQGHRLSRPRKTREYAQWVQEAAELAGNSEQVDQPSSVDDRQEILLDTLMLGLRLADGLSLSELAEQFGLATVEQILTCLQPYYRQGWLELPGLEVQPGDLRHVAQHPDQWQGQHLRLSDPEGFLFSNTVLATLFNQLS